MSVIRYMFCTLYIACMQQFTQGYSVTIKFRQRSFSFYKNCSAAIELMSKCSLEHGCAKVWKLHFSPKNKKPSLAEASFLTKLKAFNFSFHYLMGVGELLALRRSCGSYGLYFGGKIICLCFHVPASFEFLLLF